MAVPAKGIDLAISLPASKLFSKTLEAKPAAYSAFAY